MGIILYHLLLYSIFFYDPLDLFGMPCLTTQKMRHMVKVHGMEIMGEVHGRSHATIEYFVRKNKPKETFEQKHLKEHSIKSRSPKGAADVNIRHFLADVLPIVGLNHQHFNPERRWTLRNFWRTSMRSWPLHTGKWSEQLGGLFPGGYGGHGPCWSLVGGLDHFLFFHILGISSSQTDFHIFQRGRAQLPSRSC